VTATGAVTARGGAVEQLTSKAAAIDTKVNLRADMAGGKQPNLFASSIGR
jgi:hypothetical protein